MFVILISRIKKFEETHDIDMQESPYLKAYKEKTICEVCVYDFEIKEKKELTKHTESD